MDNNELNIVPEFNADNSNLSANDQNTGSIHKSGYFDRRFRAIDTRTAKKNIQGQSSYNPNALGMTTENSVHLDGLTVVLDSAAKGILSPRTAKLYKYFEGLTNEVGYSYADNLNCRVTTTLTELMNLWGLKDRKSARKRFISEIASLAEIKNVSLHVDHKNFDFELIPMIGGACRLDKKGNVEFTFSADFMKSVLSRNAPYEWLNDAIYLVNDQYYHHAFVSGLVLNNNYFMNISKNKRNCISVQSFIDSVTTLPQPDDVANSRQTELVIQPMQDNLDHLIKIGFLEDWHYCHKGRKPLTNDELDLITLSEHEQEEKPNATCKPMPYKIAKDLFIEYELAGLDSPDAQKFIQDKLTNREHHIIIDEAARQRNLKLQEKKQNAKARRLGEIEAEKQSNNLLPDTSNKLNIKSTSDDPYANMD